MYYKQKELVDVAIPLKIRFRAYSWKQLVVIFPFAHSYFLCIFHLRNLPNL